MSKRNEGRPGYKETKVGWIPEDWKCVRFQDVVEKSQYGLNIATTNEGTIPIIGMAQLQDGKINSDADNGKVEITANEFEDYRIKAGDILFNRTNSLTLVGKSAVAEREINAVFASYIVRFKVRRNQASPFFLGYYLNGHRGDHQLKSLATKGVSQCNINPSVLRKHFSLPFPPLPEQRKIAEILSIWDRAIELVEQQIETKQRLKRGLMQQLLTGKARLNGASGDWTTMCLGDIGAFSKGAGITKADLVDEGLPCIRYGEIYTQHDFIIKDFVSYIPPKIAANSQRIYSGDILFAGSGETAEEIGKCVAFIGDETAYAGGDIIILRLKKGDPSFLGYLLNNDVANRQKYRLGQGHSVVHIYADLLKTITIPFPSIEEQQKIASVFVTLEREIENLHSKVDGFQRQKQGLMQKLLTGELRVKV